MGASGIFGEAVDRIGGEPIPSRFARKAPLRHLDPALAFITLALAAYGAVMIWSATVHVQTRAGLDPNAYLTKQVIYICLGLAGFLVVSLFDYRYLKSLAPIVYGTTLLLLLVVLSPIGTTVQGAKRWIDLGAFNLQPSEFAKLAVIVTLAAYLAERKGDVRKRDIAVCCGLVALQGALIYKEPDLGTMMVFVALIAALLLVAGTKLRHMLGLVVLGVVAIAIVVQTGILAQYQVDRITAFLDPNPNVQSVGYNLTQSKIAIGSGGVRGKGIEGKNTQTSLDYVPEQHTDFIFTAVGEQLGFVGSAVLLGLFALLIWRALRIASISRDLFGSLIASGVAAFWAFQVFVNVGMTMGIMPIAGIPLPFISFGGSSLLTNFIAVGLLMNVHMRRYV